MVDVMADTKPILPDCTPWHQQLTESNRRVPRRKKRNLIGMRFGRLVVLSYIGYIRQRGSMWGCLCDCGGTKIVLAQRLTTGNTQSCGCLWGELRSCRHLHQRPVAPADTTTLQDILNQRWTDADTEPDDTR